MIADQLTCGYGDVTVVRPLDLEVRPGEVLALLGPNGAGKTTLLLTLAGILPRLGGRIDVDSRPVLVPDDRSLFPGLSVEENIEVARRRRSRPARAMVELFPALAARWKVAAGNLSGGEQQMLALARALVQEPRVLLIDELSLGLAPVVVESLLPIVRRVADETGAAVVVVEQHVQFALRMADRALVLVHGEVRLHAPAADLARRPADLEAAYLGPRSMEGDM